MSFIYLEVLHGKEPGKRYLLPDGAISIGRNTTNDIVLHSTEMSVSGHHAIIYKTQTRTMVQDLRSTNGTFVNGSRINEKDLSINDEIGFGKTGPKLKLINSESQQDCTNFSNPPDKSGAKKTNIPVPNQTSRSDHQNPSLTFQLEQKLFHQNINTSELQMLICDRNRLERVLKNRNDGKNFDLLLRAFYRANKSLKKKWLYAFITLLIVCLIAVSVFGIKTAHYRELLMQAQTLRSDLDSCETRIRNAREIPQQDHERLSNLIAELEQKQKSLQTLKTRIDKKDFADFYSDPLEIKIEEILTLFGESNYHIPAEMLRQVRYHLDIYSGRQRKNIARYIKRKEKYFPMIHKIFREKNIPIELAYLSVLESGLDPLALSHAGARGIWQFMPHTARRFGLVVNETVDERIDPEKSTLAAARYLGELIGIFGAKSSVMLCMAAYNAGEGRVLGALRKIENPMHNRDFWFIYRMGYLTEETNEYIPRVIALMILSKYPMEYGLGKPLSEQKNTQSETGLIEFADFP